MPYFPRFFFLLLLLLLLEMIICRWKIQVRRVLFAFLRQREENNKYIYRGKEYVYLLFGQHDSFGFLFLCA